MRLITYGVDRTVQNWIADEQSHSTVKNTIADDGMAVVAVKAASNARSPIRASLTAVCWSVTGAG
ncbi:hypothetical protein ACFZB5_24330 [Streptomyces nodosus]|uniref:hypothetical protein n=1 Tax=Streptomyces nodosus TaxID=40318 RepID=UPI0036EBD409